MLYDDCLIELLLLSRCSGGPDWIDKRGVGAWTDRRGVGGGITLVAILAGIVGEGGGEEGRMRMRHIATRRLLSMVIRTVKNPVGLVCALAEAQAFPVGVEAPTL